MRISDWSSDVCSSDLDLWHPDRAHPLFRGGAGHRAAGLRRHRRARQIPDAGGGHRMIQAPDLPTWAAIIIALLVLGGSILTLVGALGLIRLPTFYARVHATTLGATAGMAAKIGSAHVCTPVTNAPPVCPILLS